MHTSGYLYVEPNSHFYDSIDMFINALQLLDWSSVNFYESKNHIMIGLKNTKNRGYELQLLASPPSEIKVCDALEYCGRECPGVDKCQK